ncbi:MAG: hypothetical protein ABSA42_18860 [Terracidiphilus sp.]|jgi:hypothetical protein
MSASHIPDIGASRKTKLPRRDWILLPLLSVLTILTLAISMQWIGRVFFRSDNPVGDCIVSDPLTGRHGVPNRACWKKESESPSVDYSFNSCGHRAGMECGPKAPDTYRIVLTGSSYAFGWTVPREETFAALLPLELSRRTGRKIELYNEGIIGDGGIPRNVVKRFNEVLAAQPDAILWVLDPWDIDKADRDAPTLAWRDIGAAEMARQALVGKSRLEVIPTILGLIRDKWVVSKAGMLIQHYIFLSQSEYVKLYLARGAQSGFLDAEPDSDWRHRLELFNGYAADFEGQANAAGVPVIVTLVPNRAQAAMISMGHWPPGDDPYKLGEEVRAIVASHGGTYIDILPDFRAVPNPEQYFYPIDNHPDASGHAIIAEMLARELTSGSVPALSAADQSRSALEKGR